MIGKARVALVVGLQLGIKDVELPLVIDLQQF